MTLGRRIHIQIIAQLLHLACSRKSAEWLACVRLRCDRTKIPITLREVAFIATAAAIYSPGQGLRTFTAEPRSTQPSTLRGTVK